MARSLPDHWEENPLVQQFHKIFDLPPEKFKLNHYHPGGITAMVRKTSRIVCALALLCALSSAARAQEEYNYKEIPNFHRVNAAIFRGGQPIEGGLKILASLGIRTIVNLRDDDERAYLEREEAIAAGLRYFNISLASFDRPKDDEVERVLAVISAPENQPVFIHCKRGADRTGIVIACYRIVHDNWTGERAKEEAKRYGLGWWQVKMKDYIGDYYERQSKRGAKVIGSLATQRRQTVV